jgi:anaerobic selenocysteine-containing dehydrogenase
MSTPSRRDFLKHTAAATFAASAIGASRAGQPDATSPGAKPLQPAKVEVLRRPFGKTDMTVAILGWFSRDRV